ncbi:MAG: tripartite tricarboxylate transporter substrate binding protein [Proteobacteria bacterium]|nr:tripartite tricarboxylate transporter substrate binding protein [Pseudomonadota bacterium]
MSAPAQSADSYPVKPVRLVTPFPPGGGTDILARALAPRMSESLGGSVIVENRSGAGGLVGIEAVARTAPDGYTLLLVSGSLTIIPSLFPNVRYDPVKDFTPVTLATRQPYIAVVHPSLPAKNIRELIALARARPGQVTYASAGSGGAGHLGMELLKTMVKVNIVHIPYKGSGPALIDVLGGHVSLMFASAPSAMPHIKTGRLRALAMTGSQQSAAVPGVPTIAESGLPGFETYGWYGVLAPAGTAPPIIARVHGAIIKAMAAPEVMERIVADGSEAVAGTPEQFADYIKRDIPKWAKVIKESGARAD